MLNIGAQSGGSLEHLVIASSSNSILLCNFSDLNIFPYIGTIFCCDVTTKIPALDSGLNDHPVL
jgi:hypothetical protein